jgi:C4-dicarboxylate-specific signal transduction histidine kinase
MTMLESDILEQHVEADISGVLDCGVTADKAQIQQVLFNLLLNAIVAVQDRPPDQRKVEIRTTLPRGEMIVSVCDSGPGIPEHQIPRMLVTPFQTTKKHGLGIGLMICRSILESHGGRFGYSNNPNGGATFSFSLPLAEDAVTPTDAQERI